MKSSAWLSTGVLGSLSLMLTLLGSVGLEGAAPRVQQDGGAVAPGLVLHVSPDGSDARSGATRAESLATPAGARDRLRAVRDSGAAAAGASIIFHGGVYELDATFELTPQDSGSEDAPVIYAAADGERVTWSGGTRLDAWEPAGEGLWTAATPEWAAQYDGPAFRSLWMGPERAAWAGDPLPGSFLHIEGFPDDQPQGNWTEGQRAFRYAEADAAVWQRVEPGAEVVTFTRWVDSHLRIESVDPATRTVRLANPNVFQLAPGDLYRIEGAAGLLDQPGEWCAVGEAIQLRSAERPSGVVVPRLTTLVRLVGDPETGAWIEHVEFRGIEFAHARWWFDDSVRVQWPSAEVIGFVQAAFAAPGAVVAVGARRVTFDSCRVAHTEAYGIELSRGCRDNAIRRCTIEDLGAGGLKLGEPAIREGELVARENRIEDCTLRDGGKIHHQAVGIWVGQSPGNRIAHNLISDFDYTGISIGWTWGYGPAAAIGNLVEYNEVRNLGARAGNREPPLGDMAGIYTLGTQADGERATTIRHNYFHDIAGRTIGWGIYFDEGSTGIVAENNVVLRTTHGSFHQHYGRDNVVRNNILLLGRDAQLWRTRREEHPSFTLEKNIVVRATGALLNGDWSDHFTSRNNVFWSIDGKAEFPGGVPLEQWAPGRDEGSRVADPGVLAVSDQPWIIASDSPALELGFVPFDLQSVGPRSPDRPDSPRAVPRAP